MASAKKLELRLKDYQPYSRSSSGPTAASITIQQKLEP